MVKTMTDAAARVEALDIRRSIVLQAPAGSGKTTVLVCRMLALLAAETEPESILAITFSRKAAAELRHRVLNCLRQPDAEPDPPELARLAHAVLERDRELGWGLLDNPSRLRIQTIDAFNQRLAAMAPQASHGVSLLPVSEDATVLYQRAARSTLEWALRSESLAPALSLVFSHLDNNWRRIELLVAELLASREQWLPHLLSADTAELLDQVAQSLARLVADMLDRMEHRYPLFVQASTQQMLRQIADNLGVGQPRLLQSGDRLNYWRSLTKLALNADGKMLRSRPDKRQGVPTDDKAFKNQVNEWLAAVAELEDILPALQELRELPDMELSALDGEVLRGLSPLLLAAAAELQLAFLRSGRVDFSYMAGAARAALVTDAEPTELAFRLGTALRHVLVDEFQDTSLEQMALLRALTADWNDGDGRTVFLVGDPMQSIYQFRAADVSLFLQTRTLGLGHIRLRSLELHCNFRSGPGVVDWVNSHIGALFPPQAELRLTAIPYLAAMSARPELAAKVVMHATITAADSRDDKQREAQQVLDVIASERRANPDASIAVLVASRTHASAIVTTLQAGGVPVRGIKLEPLRDRDCVRDLVSLTRALQHIGDRGAWLALLRSPLCGLEWPEIQSLAAIKSAAVTAAIARALSESLLPQAAHGRLNRLMTALQPALTGVLRNEPLHVRTHQCWLRLGGATLYASRRDRSDVQSCLAVLEKTPDVATFSGDQFAALLEKIYATPGDEAGAIEILTMHAAKGLEWDVVIVPGLHRSKRADSSSLLEWLGFPGHDGRSELLLGVVAGSNQSEQRPLANYIRWLKSQRQRFETLRLLYVTATRAKQHLHWLGAVKPADDGELKPPGRSDLALLWPVVQQEFAAAARTDEPTGIARLERPRSQLLSRLPLDWLPTTGIQSPVVARLPISIASGGVEPEYSWVGRTGRAVGTVIHAELQRFAGAPAGTEWRSAEFYAAWLAQLGVRGDALETGAGRIRQALDATLADERGRWILDSSQHRQSWSERRLSGLHNGQLVTIVIDRMLLDQAGTRWIVDFKTGAHEGANLDAFIAMEVERYRPQLQRYAYFARLLGPETVRCALYFPLLGRFETVG
jgi:ATP-dependent exoDNAse (exonuclease V) beta subunit